MSELTIRVGGVPEYFTKPWHVAQANGWFTEQGVEVAWTDYPTGTGAMMQALRDNQLDVAIALTEGVVSEIVQHDTCRIARYFVKSPLTWGIHVPASSDFQHTAELEHETFAISRYGSGSHLMTYVLGQQEGWATERLQFAPVGKLDDARIALVSGAASGFLWEKYTTQFLVDRGDFRRVGTINTPWPCFVVAVRTSWADHIQLQKVLQAVSRAAHELKQQPAARTTVAEEYGLPTDSSARWWDVVWANDNSVEKTVLHRVLQTLSDLRVIDHPVRPEQLCNEACQLV